MGNKKENNETVTRVMARAITHRGPDDEGFFTHEKFSLGMRRLSIIDIEGGKQPIISEKGNVIVFNGEIYNYKELRAELKGYNFKTESDTETILALYETEGIESVKKLRGMFVFAIYDANTEKIFVARDYFGIKPVYYAGDGKKIIGFASEVKSLLKIPGLRREVNPAAFYNYLSYQYNPLEETFFKGIYSLPPSTYLTINPNDNSFTKTEFSHFSISPNENMEEKSGAEEALKIITDSVEHHMISDVPVGAFLSGGIDSASIVSLMQKISGERKIKTFTVGFEGFSEGNASKETADMLQTDHTEYTVSKKEYFSVLSNAAYHFDEPVGDPSAIGLYFLAKEARKKVKVVLSGEGADELFGGYTVYREALSRANFEMFTPKLIRTVLKSFLRVPFEFKGKNFLRRFFTPLEERYIGNARIFTGDELSELWRAKPETKHSLKHLYEKVKNLSDMAKMQYIDIQTWLIGDILAKADKMTMVHSLELRVPFLDKKVAEFACSIPDSLKFKNGTTKYLLREAMSTLIPESTRKRRKLGFPVPLADWLREDAGKAVFDEIRGSGFLKEYLNTKQIEKLIDEHKRGKDNARKIYVLYLAHLWYQVYFVNIDK